MSSGWKEISTPEFQAWFIIHRRQSNINYAMESKHVGNNESSENSPQQRSLFVLYFMNNKVSGVVCGIENVIYCDWMVKPQNHYVF